jgi:hypothetical protein
MKYGLGLVLAAAMVFALSGPLWAQPNPDKNYSGPEQGLYEGPDYVWFYDVKSPRLEESQNFSTNWILHVSWTATNYCGFLIDLQYDGLEMSSITLQPLAPHMWVEPPGGGALFSFVGFAGSQPGMTTVSPIAFWINPTQAAGSGMTIHHTDILPMFRVAGHVKAVPNPPHSEVVNSDVDITISVWDIWHIAQPGAYTLFPSDWVYKTIGGMNWEFEPGFGKWIHNPDTVVTFVPASAFIATGMSHSNVAGYGIDHYAAPTPIEPLSIILVLGGVGAVVAGRLRQKRSK